MAVTTSIGAVVHCTTRYYAGRAGKRQGRTRHGRRGKAPAGRHRVAINRDVAGAIAGQGPKPGVSTFFPRGKTRSVRWPARVVVQPTYPRKPVQRRAVSEKRETHGRQAAIDERSWRAVENGTRLEGVWLVTQLDGRCHPMSSLHEWPRPRSRTRQR